MDTIEVGDKVRHKQSPHYNSLLINVTDIDDQNIHCEYFDIDSKTIKQANFNLIDLEVVQKVDGGFL